MAKRKTKQDDPKTAAVVESAKETAALLQHEGIVKGSFCITGQVVSAVVFTADGKRVETKLKLSDRNSLNIQLS
jgi:hypothetical protein